MPHVLEAPGWLNSGDTSWQITAATLVGLMSVPGLVVLYGGVMQKRWSMNSMMLTFVAFAAVLVVWVLWAFNMGFGKPWHGLSSHGFFGNFIGIARRRAEPYRAASTRSDIPLVGSQAIPAVVARLLPVRVRRDHADPDARLGARARELQGMDPVRRPVVTCVYTVDAFLLWGGGWFAQNGAVDFSGGYVIHLSAGVSGFVAAAVIGPRLQRDREIDAPNNLAMVAVGAGLLWLGWNGFNGGDPYAANMSAAAAVLNTNLATAVAFLVWVGCDYATGRKPGLICGCQRHDRRPRRDHPRSRLCQRLGRDRHRRDRLGDRLRRAELPEPRAPVPQRR